MADIDFSKTKKKKKTKFEVEKKNDIADHDIDKNFYHPLVFDGLRKKRLNAFIRECIIYDDQSAIKDEVIDEHIYEEYLRRVFDKLYASNPKLMDESSRKLKMVPPSLAKVGSKKTSFVNFSIICKCINRDSTNLKQFLENELGTTSSVDQNNSLLLRGRFLNKQIESVLKNYCRSYVLCKTCHSSTTNLEKDNRLLFLDCKACGSRYSVDQQSAGYKALTTKRAAIRAKAQ